MTGYYLIAFFGRSGAFGEPLLRLTGWGIPFTWVAASIAAAVVSLPIMVRSASAALGSVDHQLEEASYCLGNGRVETFFRITLPLAGRGLLAGSVLSFSRALGQFGATVMLAGNIPGRTQTMPLAIYEAVASGEVDRARTLGSSFDVCIRGCRDCGGSTGTTPPAVSSVPTSEVMTPEVDHLRPARTVRVGQSSRAIVRKDERELTLMRTLERCVGLSQISPPPAQGTALGFGRIERKKKWKLALGKTVRDLGLFAALRAFKRGIKLAQKALSPA